MCITNFSLSAQSPVITSHPRIFLDATTKAELLTKKANSDADWLSLKADADAYATSTVMAWNPTSAAVWGGAGNIFYSYCGSSWEEAALALGMAHQLSKANIVQAGGNPTAYSNKLMQFADEIVAAYTAYPPNAGGDNIFQFNSGYATRHTGKTIGIIYDWCYDELSPARKAALINVMVSWFNYMRVPYSVNQTISEPTGNYFLGHVICAAYMGYAISGDSPASQQMIDYARQRVLGTQSGSLTPTDLADNYFKQGFTGGIPSGASQSYLGPSTYLAAPQVDGIPIQGWSYGGESLNYLIDYCFLVKSATTEVMADNIRPYLNKTSETLVHAFTPNRFQLDNSNDCGSHVGSVASYGLLLRLAAVSEGTPIGANAQYFYKNWVQPVTLTGFNNGYPALSWEKLLYEKARPATAFAYSPYYPIPTTNVYSAVPINSGLHKFYMRKDWSATTTWCSYDLGIGVYDQHNHNNAGHFKIIRGDAVDGDDHLLVGANEVGKGNAFGENGIEGPSNYAFANSYSNTLFLNDFNDYKNVSYDYINTIGGQTSYGYDEPTHEEQNDDFSHFRADLTSAYYVSYSAPLTSARSLTYYYRSFIYLRSADIFLVYDNLLAKNSTHALGQYKKHLRWHFLENPTISGNNITAQMGNSKLFVHTVLPAAVNIAKVNESNNPDNTFGSGVNYLFNTYTWRAEVSVTGNPLKQDILTVLQPGGLASAEMTTTSLATIPNNMEGTIVQVNGNTEVVLFSNSVLKYPAPIISTSYLFAGAGSSWHTLCGMLPNSRYLVTQVGTTVTVTASNTGTFTASLSGVLRFPLTTATIYVRKDGNDANNGLTNTALGAKLTLTGGVAAVPDGGLIVWNTGTYNENVLIAGKSFSLQGVGNPVVQSVNMNATANAVNLIGAIGISELLNLQAGNIITNGNLSLLSNATQQGMVVNAGGTITGVVNVQRFVPSYAYRITVQGYNYFSSPVSGKTIAEFNDDVPLVLNPNYDFVSPYSGSFPNFYRYTESKVSNSPTTFNVFEKGWQSPALLTEPLEAGRGYILNLNSGNTIDFLGNLNNGNLSLPMTRGAATNSGWNLVGNPYPAPIDFDALYTLNNAEIDGYNYRRIATATYSGSWAYYVQGMMGTGTNGSTNEIALGQGFFIRKANIGNTNLNFTDAMRLTTYKNPQFYRVEGNENPDISGLLKIEIAGKIMKDETIIYFRKNATTGFDNAFDAPKAQFNTGGAPNIFTRTNNQNFAINGQPTFEKETIIPLHLRVAEKGSFSLKTTKSMNFEGSPSIYLEDRQLNIMHNILEKDYAFESNVTYDSTRFFLRFLPDLSLKNSTVDENNQLILFPNPADNEIQLSLKSSFRGKLFIQITDLLGREILQREVEKKDEKMSTKLGITNLPKGAYFLKINGLNYFEIKKFIK